MSLKGKEILVIDKDTQYQFFVNNILSNMGITISQATSYDEAKKKLAESVPHLIITEMDLKSEGEGLEIQKYLRESKVFKSIPLFVVTSNAQKQTLFRSMALGAQEYILKPIVAKSLIQKIRLAFRDYQAPVVNFIDDESGELKEQFTNLLGDDFSLEIQSDINLRSINELSCILQGPVKFPNETVVQLNSDLLNEIGGDGLGFRSIENGRSIEAGIFSTRFSLIGIDEKTAQKIRSLRVTKT